MPSFNWDGETFEVVPVGKVMPPEHRAIKRWLGAPLLALDDVYEVTLAVCAISVKRARPGFKLEDADRLWDTSLVTDFAVEMAESAQAEHDATEVTESGTGEVLSPTPNANEGSEAGT